MFACIRQFAVLAAAIALCAVSSAARADIVRFYTTGSFSAGTAGGNVSTASTATTASITVDNPVNGMPSTLTYNFNGSLATPEVVGLIDGVGNTDFGTFTVASTDTAAGFSDNFAGALFTLNIFQVDPVLGSGSLVGSLTGKLDVVSGPVLGSTLVVTIDPNQITIPSTGGVQYTIEPPAGVITIEANDETEIEGIVTVPVPAVAWAGFALFGGLGLKRFRRGEVASA